MVSCESPMWCKYSKVLCLRNRLQEIRRRFVPRFLRLDKKSGRAARAQRAAISEGAARLPFHAADKLHWCLHDIAKVSSKTDTMRFMTMHRSRIFGCWLVSTKTTSSLYLDVTYNCCKQDVADSPSRGGAARQYAWLPTSGEVALCHCRRHRRQTRNRGRVMPRFLITRIRNRGGRRPDPDF